MIYDFGTVIYRCGFDFVYPELFRFLKFNKMTSVWSYDIQNSYISLYCAMLDMLFDKSYYVREKYHFHKTTIKDKTVISLYEVGKRLSKSDISMIDVLNLQQREFLTWLVDDDRFWEKDHNLLVWYGLPASRDGLRKFVEKYSHND
jgi:hypothetical protein